MVPDETARIPVYEYSGLKKAKWPEADFVVGNPPFIGGKDIRAWFGDGYVKALRKVYEHVPESADFVMYWWQRAAELGSRRKDSALRLRHHQQHHRRSSIAGSSPRILGDQRPSFDRLCDSRPPVAESALDGERAATATRPSASP